MNTKVIWDRNSFSQIDTVSKVPLLIDTDMVRESNSSMKNEKASGPSGLVSETVKAAKEAGLDIMQT